MEVYILETKSRVKVWGWERVCGPAFTNVDRLLLIKNIINKAQQSKILIMNLLQ